MSYNHANLSRIPENEGLLRTDFNWQWRWGSVVSLLRAFVLPYWARPDLTGAEANDN